MPLLVCLLLWSIVFVHGNLPRRHLTLGSRLTTRTLLPTTTLTVVATDKVNQHVYGSSLVIRGGAQSDEDDSEVEEDEDEEETSLEISAGIETALTVCKRLLGFATKITIRTLKVTSRVILAAFEEDPDVEESEDGEVTVVTTVVRALQRMWTAAWNPDEQRAEDGDEDDEFEEDMEEDQEDTASKGVKSEKTLDNIPDFGRFLSSSYNIDATRDDLDDALPVMGGSISDALKIARSKARLLVVLIPAHKPSKKADRHSVDTEAMEGFLSAEVATVAEKRARKNGETGSYILWGAKAGSAEAIAAIKRLKAKQTNSKGHKRPVLLVAYPAQVSDRGIPKVVPRLLAQHHCTPPPTPEMMAAWLNALRKRHAKQFASMQLEVREEQLFNERREGYKDSVQADRERQERERREEMERKAREKVEKQRREAIERRREELRESLPDEPDSSSTDSKTIALRMSDGRSLQRRFYSHTKLGTLFDWVDVSFELERERVVLTTMNGQKTFDWDTVKENKDATLSDVGLGRMAGFRVSESSPDEKAAASPQ